MTDPLITRRTLLAATAVLTAGIGLRLPARAQGLAPTPSMRGGSNNYRPDAPIVDRIGGGGFWMTGAVRRAGDGATSSPRCAWRSPRRAPIRRRRKC